ncbi:MAG: cytochrome P450 [Acetobacteraceae bacterium]|nr:cytochrome P450 [Acetobacteraceae bacterium]
MSIATAYIPPVPSVPLRPLSLPAFLRAVRTNALGIWPEAAYEQEAMEQSILGRRTILLNQPDAIHRVLVENHENYRRSPASIRILRPITGNGLLLAQGEDWRLQRRTVAPALTPRVLPLLMPHVAAVAQETVAFLRLQAGRDCDLLAAMQVAALEVAGRSMFSMEMRELGPGLRALIQEFGQRCSHPTLLDLLLPPSVPTPRDLVRWRFKLRWMRYVERIMEARLAVPTAAEARDLFDLLLEARDPESGKGFSREQLRDQVATLMLAGHATTAETLFWALTLLSRVAAEQELVAAEVGAVDLSPEGAAAALPTLVRTRAVISEALRLYPPAFAIARAAIAADRAAGIDIAPGTVLLIAPWVLHRHRRLWRDPTVFDPSRFMPDAPQPPRFAYLPFGAGPRVCVGAQFALAEATLVLAALIQNFEIAMDPTEVVLPVAIVTTQPDHPPRFRLRARTGRVLDQQALARSLSR